MQKMKIKLTKKKEIIHDLTSNLRQLEEEVASQKKLFVSEK